MARKGVVCVFSKAPVAGEVKTRLIPELGAEGAAQLYESLLVSTLVQACASNVSSVHLYCFPDASHPSFQYYADKHHLTLVNQSGSDLEKEYIGLLNRNCWSSTTPWYLVVIAPG